MKKIVLIFVLCLGVVLIHAQTVEELKALKSKKLAEADAFQAEANALQSQIDAFPGWKLGAFGTIGGSISEFSNWYRQGSPNIASGNIGFTVNGFVNLNREKFFWNNATNVNLSWVKLNNKDDLTDNKGFIEVTDVFNMTSVYGYKLSKKWAASTLAEYRTTVLNNYNNPGYLDIGLGATWTPIKDLIAAVHPLNYNFVFSKEDSVFESSLGAKIVIDYTRQIKIINFKTNVSIFQSYKSTNFSNWAWTNSFGYRLWKMIGVGFDFGLRQSKQEALNYNVNNVSENLTFNTIDNKVQSYWLAGLNYSL